MDPRGVPRGALATAQRDRKSGQGSRLFVVPRVSTLPLSPGLDSWPCLDEPIIDCYLVRNMAEGRGRRGQLPGRLSQSCPKTQWAVGLALLTHSLAKTTAIHLDLKDQA